jgi:hypothetical protein
MTNENEKLLPCPKIREILIDLVAEFYEPAAMDCLKKADYEIIDSANNRIANIRAPLSATPEQSLWHEQIDSNFPVICGLFEHNSEDVLQYKGKYAYFKNIMALIESQSIALSKAQERIEELEKSFSDILEIGVDICDMQNPEVLSDVILKIRNIARKHYVYDVPQIPFKKDTAQETIAKLEKALEQIADYKIEKAIDNPGTVIAAEFMGIAIKALSEITEQEAAK